MKKNWIQTVTLLLCLVLLVIVIAQGYQMDRYQQSMDKRMNMLQSHVSMEIDSVYDRLEASLEERERLVDGFFSGAPGH